MKLLILATLLFTTNLFADEPFTSPTTEVSRFPNGIIGDVTGNCTTVTNGVYTEGDQTIGGVKTFASGGIKFSTNYRFFHKSFSGTLDGSGNFLVPHGLGGNAPVRIMSISAGYQGNSGEYLPLTNNFNDGFGISLIGGQANRPFYVHLFYTDVPIGW